MKSQKDHQNRINRSSDLMRLTHLEIFETLNYFSPIIQASKKAIAVPVAIVLLVSRTSREKTATPNSSTSILDAQISREEIQAMQELLEAVKIGSVVNHDWNFELMWIVARKAIVLKNNEA